MKAKVDIKGIIRATPNYEDGNGNCLEVINMRFKDGAWRSVGTKLNTTLSQSTSYRSFYKHPILQENVIIAEDTSSDEVRKIRAAIGGSVLQEILVDLGAESSTLISIAHINSYLIITTSVNRHIFKYDSNTYAYDKLEDLQAPYLSTYTEVDEVYTQTSANTNIVWSSAKAVLAVHITEKRKENLLFGWIAFRLAYKLYDGTYLYYSAIHHHEIMNINQSGDNRHRFYSYSNQNRFTRIPGGTVDLRLYLSDVMKTELAKYDGLIKSLVIFSTDLVDYFDMSTDDYINEWYEYVEYKWKVPESIVYVEELLSKSGMYNVHEIPYNDLKDLSGNTYDIEELDLSFIDAIETRESMPLWTNPHKVAGERSLLYNGRIHFGNIYNFLFQGNDHSWYEHQSAYTTVQEYAGDNTYYIAFWINTDQGEKIVKRELKPFEYFIGEGTHYVIFNPILIYPDTRCFQFLLYRYDDGRARYEAVIASAFLPMKPHPYLNLSYWAQSSLNKYVVNDDAAYTECSDPTVDNILNYKNQFRLSAVNNPVIYPPENSYNVANEDSEVLGFGTMAEPLSEGQMGQFPLFIFCEEGIYFAELGTTVVYQSLTELNKEVCNNADSIVGIGGAILFSTNRGLQLLRGREVQELSAPVEGAISNLLADSGIPTYIANADKILATTFISAVSFLTYLSGAIIALDYKNNEIIISNSTYTYSYVYCFDNGAWYKLDKVYKYFYKELSVFYAYDDSLDLYLMDTETSSYVNILIYTRPFQLGTGELKKIKSGMLDGYISKEDDTFAAIYLYGSLDMEDWALVSATELNKELTQYSPEIFRAPFSAKYFILVVSGSFKDTIINSLILDYDVRFTNKLR